MVSGGDDLTSYISKKRPAHYWLKAVLFKDGEVVCAVS